MVWQPTLPSQQRADARYSSDKARQQSANNRRREQSLLEPHTFIGVDGEGETTPLPIKHHYYVMLSVGDVTLHKNGEPLDFEEIAEFLWERFLDTDNKDAVFVGFFLAYDFTMWLKNLPYHRAKMLYRPEDIARRQRKRGKNAPPFPVYYGDWEFDLLNDHRFKLRKKDSNEPWLWICDAGPFFQSSFLTAIDPSKWTTPVVSTREFELIKAGKNNRSAAIFGAEMERYNILENEILSRVMVEYDKGLLHMGIRLRRNQYFGPGQVASAWLKSIGAPTREWAENNIPRKFLEAAQASYYGGWFEIFMHGKIPGNVWEYDINSAYPTIIKDLPCLQCGTWNYQKYAPSASAIDAGGSGVQELVLVYATCKQSVSNNAPIGSMPHRTKDGTILRPRNTAGWYWYHEILASKNAGLIDELEIHSAWIYTTQCTHKPFAAIAELYSERLLVGKDSPLGKTLKLVYNSVYGKLAQSVGSPVYSNPIYASLVTSGCRSMILSAIASHPNGLQDVTMVATDGVYFRSPHPGLDIGENLGQWGEAIKQNLTQHQPGLYWDDKARNTNNPVFKSRGVSPNDIRDAIPSLDRQWEVMVKWVEGGYHIFDESKIHKYAITEFKFWERVTARPIFSKSKKKQEKQALDFYNAIRTRWPRVDIPIKFALVGARIAVHRHNWSLAGTIDSNARRTISSTPVDKRDIDSAYVDASGVIRTRPYVQSRALVSTPYSRRFGLELRNQLLEQNGVFSPDGTFRDEMYEMLKNDDIEVGL